MMSMQLPWRQSDTRAVCGDTVTTQRNRHLCAASSTLTRQSALPETHRLFIVLECSRVAVCNELVSTCGRWQGGVWRRRVDADVVCAGSDDRQPPSTGHAGRRLAGRRYVRRWCCRTHGRLRRRTSVVVEFFSRQRQRQTSIDRLLWLCLTQPPVLSGIGHNDCPKQRCSSRLRLGSTTTTTNTPNL